MERKASNFESWPKTSGCSAGLMPKAGSGILAIVSYAVCSSPVSGMGNPLEKARIDACFGGYMRRLLLCWLLLGSLAFAKDHEWKTAKVLKQFTVDGGTEAAIVPIGTALYGVSTEKRESYYAVQVERVSYTIHNYSDGKMVYRWLLLTVGGETQAYVEGKFIHV